MFPSLFSSSEGSALPTKALSPKVDSAEDLKADFFILISFAHCLFTSCLFQIVQTKRPHPADEEEEDEVQEVPEEEEKEVVAGGSPPPVVDKEEEERPPDSGKKGEEEEQVSYDDESGSSSQSGSEDGDKEEVAEIIEEQPEVSFPPSNCFCSFNSVPVVFSTSSLSSFLALSVS